ncbi:MAG: hypothetical protein HFI93_02195 [Lachnospiraceae bacterium]|nr:hypothetical protein [Lachnospiraceae bacterium]
MKITRKLLLTLLLSCSFIMSSGMTGFAQEIMQEYEEVYVDENGVENRVLHVEADNWRRVQVYIDGVLSDETVTDKNTGEMEVTVYEGNTSKVSKCYVSDFVQDVSDEELNQNTAVPFGVINPTSTYTYYNTTNTNYTYNGSILKATNYYRAYEIGNRTGGKRLTISVGTVVSTAVSLLIGLVPGAEAITIKTLISMGVSISAGVVADYFVSDVSYTTMRIYVKTVFNGIDTAIGYRDFNRALVSISSGRVVLLDDYYQTSIIGTVISSVAGRGAVAFSDKYITQSNPGLSLPILVN